jgi:DNA invertase Pin-like site-specific DNA recombinase
MRYIGYARVSTDEQNLDLQMDALKEFGVDRIFSDKMSGSKAGRPGFDAMLEYVGAGDCVVVWKLDRLGRSMIHLVATINKLNESKIDFKSLTDGIIDTTSPGGELIFNIFATLAQFERRQIQERTKAGLNAAKARGKIGGRPGLNPDDSKVVMAKLLHKDNSMAVSEMARQLGVSRNQFYKYLKVGTTKN